jgi:hypothetical protein
MDFSKYPHHRSLPASRDGERQSRMIDALGASALHRRNADGSVSRKVGGRLYVTPAPEKPLSAIYTSGVLVTGKSGVFRTASPARGFSGIGQLPFLSERGDIGYLTNNSDGTASVVNSEWAGRAADFDAGPHWGHEAGITTVDVYRTRDGIAVSNDFEAYTATALEGSGTNDWSLVSGKVIKVGERFARLRGAATITLADGHYWPTFYRVVDDGPAVVAPTWGQENTLLTGIVNLVLGPAKFLMIVRCARSEHRPTIAVNAGNPVLFAQYSLDGGASWSLVSDMSAFADEIASIKAIPIKHPNNAGQGVSDSNAEFFNRAATYFQLSSAAPISATKALALATVPYISDPERLTTRARVKIVEIDTANGCRIVEKQNIFDGRLNEALAFRGAAWPTGEGMLYTVQQVTPDAEDSTAYRSAPSLPSRVWHTVDGVRLENIGLMPEPAFCTGYPIYIDKRRIACVMYSQGVYRLFLSTDRMASWKKGGVVSAQGRAPYIDPANPLASLTLANFSAVACLRTESGAPAGLHPQAPWIHDARKPAPD